MYPKFRRILYHGTVSEITRVDVERGRDREDFGKGFYMAVSKSQAVGMMHKKRREAARRRRNKDGADIKEYLYEAALDVEYAQTLDIRVFKQADEEWLDFILKCRRGEDKSDYEVVMGGIANAFRSQSIINRCLRFERSEPV